jgi:hypothetical protein
MKNVRRVVAKKYNFVYQTKNLINGKTYIGVHSTNKLDDGYIGNGIFRESDSRHLRDYPFPRAVKKHGYSNFKREILSFYDTVEEAYEEERHIVTEDWVRLENNYNAGIGGNGSFMSENGRKKHSRRMKENNPYKGTHHPNTLKAVSEAAKDTYWATNGKNQIRVKNGKPIPNGYRKGQTRDISKQMKKEKNPMFNGYWVTPFGIFYSANSAAKVVGRHASYIRERCKGYRYQRHKGVKYIQKLDDSITKGYSFIPISNFID